MKKEPIRVAQIIGKWLGGGVEAVVMNYYRNIDRSKIQFDFICGEDSTNIPYDEINEFMGIDKNTVLFVYCKSGARSKIATETLIDLGYEVYDLGAYENINLEE